MDKIANATFYVNSGQSQKLKPKTLFEIYFSLCQRSSGEGETIDSIIKEYDLFVIRYVRRKKCWFTKDYKYIQPIYYTDMKNG